MVQLVSPAQTAALLLPLVEDVSHVMNMLIYALKGRIEVTSTVGIHQKNLVEMLTGVPPLSLV